MWNACHIYANAQCCSIDQYYPIQLNTQSFTMWYLVLLWYFELFPSNWNLEFSNMLQSLDSGSHAALG
jgi:hypothetical protein